MSSTLLNDALSYADFGFQVVPLYTPVDGNCDCGRAHDQSESDKRRVGKHPRSPHGVRDASADPIQIREWWKLWPNANVGLAAGKGSGFFDLENDPYKANSELPDALPRTVTARSGSGGLHHLFTHPGFTVPNKVNVVPGWDIRGDGGLMVAPRSIYRTNARYEWIAKPGNTKIAPAPDWLLGLLQEEATEQIDTEQYGRSAGFPKSVWRLARLLENGVSDDRSRMEYKIILAFVGASFDYETIRTFFDTYLVERSKYAEKRIARDAERWLKHNYQRALKWSQCHESEGRKIARACRAWAISSPWAGQTGATDRAVYAAHCEVASACGHVDDYQASTRTLAEIAGVNKFTASAANRRLAQSRHLIERVRDAVRGASLSHAWRLLPPEGVTLWYTSTKELPVKKCTKVARHNLFRNYKGLGLGKVGAQVFEVLQRGWVTENDLAKETGRNPRTLRGRGGKPGILGRMERLGLIERDATPAGNAWRVRDGVDENKLDQTAQALGIAWLDAKQRAKHADERRRHNQALKVGRTQHDHGGMRHDASNTDSEDPRRRVDACGR